MSWSSKQLETLVQRVEVLRLFATSNLWYKASAIPLPDKFSKKFEAAMQKFLWIGKLEKLKIDEVKNPLLGGGLNLPCVMSKADSLFLSQACRLLLSTKTREHIKYWLGIYLQEFYPEMGKGPHAEIISPFFQHMKALLSAGLVLGDIEKDKLHLVTAKKLYSKFTSTLPPPKITIKYNVDWGLVWERLQNPVLGPLGREILFLIIHNIVTNGQRVYYFNMAVSPNCLTCQVVQDNVHLFCECTSVQESWFWMRQRLIGLLPPDSCLTSNFEFLNLMFDSSVMEKEVIWLLGIYLEKVWDVVICKKKTLSLNVLISECSQQYLEHHKANKPPLGYIIGLFS